MIQVLHKLSKNDNRLFVNVQKISLESLYIVFWDHIYQIRISEIYDNKKQIGRMNISGSLRRQLEEIVKCIIHVVLSNGLDGVELSIYANEEGWLLSRLLAEEFTRIGKKGSEIFDYVSDLPIDICFIMIDEVFDKNSHLSAINKRKEIIQRLEKSSNEMIRYELYSLLKDYDEENDELENRGNPNEEFQKLFEDIRRKKCMMSLGVSERNWPLDKEEAKKKLLNWEKQQHIPQNIARDLGESGKRLKEVRDGISVQNKRVLLIYYCYLLHCTREEVEELLIQANMNNKPISLGERIMFLAMNEGIYDREELLQEIDSYTKGNNCYSLRELFGLYE